MKTTFKLRKSLTPHRGGHLKAFLHDEEGATAIEYGLIASLIIIGIIAALNTFSENTSGMYTSIANNLGG